MSPNRDRGIGGTFAAIFAALAMMFGFFAFVMAAHADSKKTGVPAGAAQVTLSEFAISPTSVQVPLDGKLVVTNSGSAPHNVHIEKTDVHTKDLSPGDSATLDLKGVKAGSYTIFCAIAGSHGTAASGSSRYASAHRVPMPRESFCSLSIFHPVGIRNLPSVDSSSAQLLLAWIAKMLSSCGLMTTVFHSSSSL